jgi:hypothetical protein
MVRRRIAEGQEPHPREIRFGLGHVLPRLTGMGSRGMCLVSAGLRAGQAASDGRGTRIDRAHARASERLGEPAETW